MGTKDRNFAPLPRNVSLEELVPEDNFYRRLEERLDLSFVRELVEDLYACSGRPSVDPEVFFKLQLVMFFEDIRSERQLMRVVADRLSLRWYLGYDLHETLPDHSSLSRIRERYGLEVFRRFFEQIVELCIEAGLVWGEELYFDATKVEANASVESLAPRFAVEAHLERLFTVEEPQSEVPEAMPDPLPVELSEDAFQELAQANAERHSWISEEGRQQREVVCGSYRRMADYRASFTDPDASLMQRRAGDSHLGYHAHYVVDGGRSRIILQALVTPSEVMENQPMLDLLWRVCFRWRIRPRQVTGDTTYGTLENIKAIEDAGIRAYVPLPDFDNRTPFFGKKEFSYDAGRDLYVCPEGQLLHRYTRVNKERVVKYRADPATCDACPAKSRCTSSSKGRQVSRSFDEQYLEKVRAYHESAAYEKAIRKRKVWVEPMFAEAKQWHGMARMRLRMLQRVNAEVLVCAAGQNIKRLLASETCKPIKPAQAAALRPTKRTSTHPNYRTARDHRRSALPSTRRFSTRPYAYGASALSFLTPDNMVLSGLSASFLMSDKL
jgi:transposase